jgi:hypothetical protein
VPPRVTIARLPHGSQLTIPFPSRSHGHTVFRTRETPWSQPTLHDGKHQGPSALRACSNPHGADIRSQQPGLPLRQMPAGGQGTGRRSGSTTPTVRGVSDEPGPPPRRLRGWPGLGGRRQRRRQLPCPGLPHTTNSRPLHGADSGRGQERAGVRLDRSVSMPGLGPGKTAGGPSHGARLRLRQLVLELEVEPRRMSASMSVMDSPLIS